MKSDADIIEQFKSHKQKSQRGLSDQYERMRICQAFYAGDIMDYKDNIQFMTVGGQKKRAMVQFNKVKPYVNVVKGFMAQNRRKAEYQASMTAGAPQIAYSKYANAMHDYCRQHAHADQIETQQDGDLLIGGIGAVETAVTYGQGYATTDPNGEIVMENLDMMQVGWDPFARKVNLLDKRWVYYQKDYDLDEALDLFDDSEEDDFQDAAEDDDEDDGGYSYYARGGRYNKVKMGLDWSDEKSNMVKVYFYQWVENEGFYRAENPITGFQSPEAQQLALEKMQSMLDDDDMAEEAGEFDFDPQAEIMTFGPKIKEELLATFGEFIEVYKFKRRRYYTAVLSGSKVFTAYPSICQTGFTVKFKTGDWDAKNKLWTGMVDSMREPALYYNKALTELMFTIGANAKGGVFVEKGAVTSLAQFEQKYAKTDSVIEVNPGALSGGKIKPKREGYIPSGNEEIVQLSDAAISDANGIDKSFLGSSENKQDTAILQRQRIRQVCSALACYFDSGMLYQIEEARLMLDLMRVWAENNVDGTFILLGPDGRNTFLQIDANELASNYAVQIQEAPQTPEERQEYAMIMTGVADKILTINPQGAMMIYALALSNMPLAPDDIQKVQQILVPQQGQINPQEFAQMQQQLAAVKSEMSQIQLQGAIAKVAIDKAKADDLTAQTHERLAHAGALKQDAIRTGMETRLIPLTPQPAEQIKVNV